MVTRDCSFAASPESCDCFSPESFAGSVAYAARFSMEEACPGAFADRFSTEEACPVASTVRSTEGSCPATSALLPQIQANRSTGISNIIATTFVLFPFSPINQTSPFRPCFCIFRPYQVNDFDLYALGFEHSVILSHNPSGDCVLYAIRIRAFGVASLNKSSFFQQIFFGIVCRAFDHICKHRLKCFANLRSRTHSGGNQVFSGHSQLM